MERCVRPRGTARAWPRAVAVAFALSAGSGPTGRAQEPAPEPAPAVAAVEALRRQEFAAALEIVERARPPLAAAKGEDDPAVLTLRILGGQASFGLGRPEDAVATLDPFLRALDTPVPLVSPTSDWNALNVLGDSFMALGRWDEALRCLDRAHTLVAGEETPAERRPGRSRAVDRATTLGKIGTVRARLEDWGGAKEAFQAQADALAAEPDGGGPYLAAAHSGLGLVADNTGDHATASVHYAEAAKIYDRSFGPDHPYAKRSRDLLARAQSRGAGPAAVALPAAGGANDAAVTAAAGGGTPAPTARFPWPAVAAVAAAGVLGWMAWSGLLRRAADVSGSGDATGGDD